MIVFRADANEFVATGHMTRCMAIAQGVRRAGDEVLFLTADETGAALARGGGFAAICLHSEWNALEPELPALRKVLAAVRADCLVIDSYQATLGYLRALRSQVKTLYFDDLDRFLCPADAVLNYSIYASKPAYEARYRETETRLLLGPEYVPLRREFARIQPTWREIPCAILITLGGSDRYGLGLAIARKIRADKRLEGMMLHLIQGVYAGAVDWPGDKAVRIHRNVTDMAALMTVCDLAVTAGGSTMYELCACGLPAVSCSVAENQLQNVKAFDAMGLIDYCGDARDGTEACIRRLTDRAAALCADPVLRKDRSQRLRKVTDGLGVERIVSELTKLCGK